MRCFREKLSVRNPIFLELPKPETHSWSQRRTRLGAIQHRNDGCGYVFFTPKDKMTKDKTSEKRKSLAVTNSYRETSPHQLPGTVLSITHSI